MFDDHDRDGNCVLVSTQAAARLWPGANPIVVIAATAAGCWLPARRATRVRSGGGVAV